MYATATGDDKPPRIEAELWRAIRVGQRLDLLEAVGISPNLATIVGVGFAQFRVNSIGSFYEPSEDGAAALIVGVVENSEYPLFGPSRFEKTDLVDLAAIELEGQRVGSRLGWAVAFNRHLIDAACWANSSELWAGTATLELLSPISWLREPDGACAVIDWQTAVITMQGIDTITCENERLAEHARRAFIRRHLPLPTLLVPK